MMNYLQLATTPTGYFKQGDTIVPSSGEITTMDSSFISPFTVIATVSAESRQITGIYFQKVSPRSFTAVLPISLIMLIIVYMFRLVIMNPAPLFITILSIIAVVVTIIIPLFHITSLLMWAQSPSPFRRWLIQQRYPSIPTYTVAYSELRNFLK